MRRTDPLILGAGPAGCAAAIVLARAGLRPVLIDRDSEPRDHLCGGFLSWATREKLALLGIDGEHLGGEPVTRLALCHGERHASAALPHASLALSRRALDTALRDAAIAAGAELVVAKIAAIEGATLRGEGRVFPFETLFLATGKRDLRGSGRPVSASHHVGLRLRVPAGPDLADMIELHLFDGGYAGVVRQEDGLANVCLAVRREILDAANGRPEGLLRNFAASHPHFARRIGHLSADTGITSIGAVPYGWIAQDTEPGIFRLGDQAAVIPSLAGEGIGIALASGMAAAEHWLDGGARSAGAYQERFARAARQPVRMAAIGARLAGHSWGRSAMMLALGAGPLALLGQLTRMPPVRA